MLRSSKASAGNRCFGKKFSSWLYDNPAFAGFQVVNLQFVVIHKGGVCILLDFDRLNELLKSKGVKKSFLADQLGKNRSIFSDWEAGKSQPKPEYITIIATLLGTTPAYLTGESDDSGLPPEPPEKQKKLLAEANSLSDAELEKALEYIQFLKSQRKG